MAKNARSFAAAKFESQKPATMRRVILGLAVSLDGFIEGPNGEYDWCFTDQDYGMSDFFKRVDAVFMGRKSYEMMLGMDSDITGMPKLQEYVFSNTLHAVEGDRILVRGDIEQKINEIKNQPGKDIWMFGGASLTAALMNLGLIDEFWLSVHPVVLGAGKPLFQNISERKNLKLLDVKTYSTGLVSLKYEPNF